MNILELIENLGFSYKKVTSSGEYAGPCPYCGGTDRFSIFPTNNHYVCRQCKTAGDAIHFLRTYCQKSYKEACSIMGKEPSLHLSSITRSAKWEPRTITFPPQAWRDKAVAILFESYKYLLSVHGKPQRDYLKSRGLTVDTIKAARIGYISSQISFDPSSWGLQPESETGLKSKNLWLPEGFVIPYFTPSSRLTPVRLRIRQTHPREDGDRYILVRGSSTGYLQHEDPFTIAKADDLPIILVESELDGWLIHQELAGQARIMSIGNAQGRPDRDAHKALSAATAIITLLDNDNAGVAEQAWWTEHYPKSHHVVVPAGKDPGDAFKLGIDLKEWMSEKLKEIHEKNNPIIENFKEKFLKNREQTKTQEQQAQVEPDTIPAATANSTPVPILNKKAQQDQGLEKFCMHGKVCIHKKADVCIIADKTPVWDLQECPQQYWYRYTDPSNPFISQIIFGLEYNRKRRNKS